MKDISKNINRMIMPIHDFQKIAEPLMGVQKLIQPVLRIQKSLENIAKVYSALTPKIEFSYNTHFDTFNKIEKTLKEYVENTPRHLLLIAEHGWFIELDCELNFPHRIVREIEDGFDEEARNYLSEYYTSNLERIFKVLTERHPSRERILHEILEGHKSEKFYLTIPTILSQVDGICFDFTRKKFFIKERTNNYLPQVTAELENISGGTLDLFLSPIKNQIPIMVREVDIPKYPCNLNRHEILHGFSTDYGTNINSLKCISLLKYISDLLIEIDR